MSGINTSFRAAKDARVSRRRRGKVRRAAFAIGLLMLLGGAGAFTAYQFRGTDEPTAADYDEELQFAEDAEQEPADLAPYVPSIVDLAGDPMWISLSQESQDARKVKSVARPAELDDPAISASVAVLEDTMISASERFMTTIPSSQEDFAFFQAQQAAAASPISYSPSLAPDADLPMDGEVGGDEAAAGWGETIEGMDAALPAFEKTAIENNTSVAQVIRETERVTPTTDLFLRIVSSRSLDSVVQEAGYGSEDARSAGEAMNALFQRGSVEPGHVVALRGAAPLRGAGTRRLMQVSIYAGNQFVGTLARDDDGRFVAGVDPWVRDDLFNYSGRVQAEASTRQYRLLDAIYSTAARNGVPTAVMGEAIMYLSRANDLNAFAAPDDQVMLIYSDTPRAPEGAGRVLYVGIHGSTRRLECFVFRQSDGQFACVSAGDQVRSLAVVNGMTTPVAGVMTSTFGPRRHPILKTVRIHKGVDWAAPSGTPVAAAFDGEIAFQGDGSGYGNLIKIRHANGRETRYAHLQKFAMADGIGKAVKAGEIIGYVGTTGLSTGPHLHFELYQNDEAIDPLASATVAVAASSGDDEAVELLVDRIVHVESGGNSRAKNPLSSATGLGQFITSTWIRMMNTYRPDLARSLSREDLLALRFDPTISREMVRNLAREGEAYLKARGHTITAGRLYLCHFLGMDGAHQVLSVSAEATLVSVLGQGVITANPFLTGKTAGYVETWAEGKMRGRGARTAPRNAPVTEVREVRETSPEFERYKAAITALLPAPPAAEPAETL